MSFGVMGGAMQPQGHAQIIVNMVDFGMDMEQAVAAPRMHHQWLPDRIRLEADAVAPEVLQTLEALGHTVQMGGRQGSANSIGVDPRTGVRMGVPDPRSADAGAVGSSSPGSR